MISRSNYEIVFIDYFDGKLDKFREEELFNFLRENPDLKEEFDLFGSVNIEADAKVKFPGKDRLKKNLITLNNYKTWLIARIENDLDENGIQETEKFLKANPDSRREFEILKLTRLVPDRRIIFDKKNSLKQGGKVVVFNSVVKRTLSIAAALLLMVVAYYFIRQTNAPKSGVAEEKKIVPIEKNNPVEKAPVLANENKSAKQPEKIIGKEKIVRVPEQKIAQAPNEKVIPVNGIYKKEIPVTLHADSLHPLKEMQNANYANNSSDHLNANIKNVKVQSPEIKMNVARINFESKNITEIFSGDEIADLKKMQEQRLSKTEEVSKQLTEVAKQELEKLSKKADIRFEKQTDPESNSISFALVLGKNFSVSHTAGR